MKIKALVVVLFVAGLAASLALASPQKHKAKCRQVELKGDATGGSAAFTVKKANKRGRSLVGTSVTLVIPVGAKVKAKACTTQGSDVLTLRDLHVRVRASK